MKTWPKQAACMNRGRKGKFRYSYHFILSGSECLGGFPLQIVTLPTDRRPWTWRGCSRSLWECAGDADGGVMWSKAMGACAFRLFKGELAPLSLSGKQPEISKKSILDLCSPFDFLISCNLWLKKTELVFSILGYRYVLYALIVMT